MIAALSSFTLFSDAAAACIFYGQFLRASKIKSGMVKHNRLHRPAKMCLFVMKFWSVRRHKTGRFRNSLINILMVLSLAMIVAIFGQERKPAHRSKIFKMPTNKRYRSFLIACRYIALISFYTPNYWMLLLMELFRPTVYAVSMQKRPDLYIGIHRRRFCNKLTLLLSVCKQAAGKSHMVPTFQSSVFTYKFSCSRDCESDLTIS